MTPDSPTLTQELIDRLRIAASVLRRLDRPVNAACVDETADALTQARAELARRAEPIGMTLQHRVYAWLGMRRDKMPPELVSELQDVLGPLVYAAPPVSAGDGREAFEAFCPIPSTVEWRGRNYMPRQPDVAFCLDAQQYQFGWECWQAALAWRGGGK